MCGFIALYHIYLHFGVIKYVLCVLILNSAYKIGK